jgi:hypothetical protein
MDARVKPGHDECLLRQHFDSSHSLAISRPDMPEVCQKNPYPLDQRAQGTPGARCTRGLVCKTAQKNAHEHTGSAEAIRHSLRNGFNGLYRALPGDRAFLPPSSRASYRKT